MHTHTQMQVNVWKTNTAKQLYAFGISQNKKKKTMCCMTICPCCRKCFDTLRFEANLFFPLFWTKTPISKPNVCLSFFAFSFFVFSNYHNGSFRPLLSKPKPNPCRIYTQIFGQRLDIRVCGVPGLL